MSYFKSQLQLLNPYITELCFYKTRFRECHKIWLEVLSCQVLQRSASPINLVYIHWYNWWLNALIPHRYKCVTTDLEIFVNSFKTRYLRDCSNFDQACNHHDRIVFLVICFRANEEKLTQNLHDMQTP